jgi:hypothetical protein
VLPLRLRTVYAPWRGRGTARGNQKHRFRAKKQISGGVIEGLNNKAKPTMRKSYGFRTFRILELALYHALAKLPEPPATHRFY